MARADASMQSKQEFRRLYGWADLSPKDPIEAGSIGSWTVTYHVGRYGIDDSGMVRVARRWYCQVNQFECLLSALATL